MLEDVIKSEIVHDRVISILLCSINKEDRYNEDNHKQFYEVRNSAFHDDRSIDWFTEIEVYNKMEAERSFNQVVKEIKEEYDKKEMQKYLKEKFMPLMNRKF